VTDLTEPHPLDDDWESDTPEPRAKLRTNAYLPLLKPCVMIAIGAFALVFLSSVATLNAPPNSPFESISSGIHTMGWWVLLAACCGIMLSYRIPHLNPIRLDRDVRGWLSHGFTTLWIVNILGIILLWCFVYFLMSAPGILMFLVPIFVLGFAGFLATVAVAHTGYLRAYAVGTLSNVFLLLNSSLGFLMFGLPSRGRVGITQELFLGFVIGIPPMIGLLCATYVLFLERIRDELASTANAKDSSP
jgi:hypothetical protein